MAHATGFTEDSYTGIELDLDCILFQSRRNYLEDQEILSPEQRRLPRIYVEHDPPRETPTDTGTV